MRSAGIQGAKRRGKPWRSTTPDQQTQRPDLVNRDFHVGAPNRLWVAHLSYVRCWEGTVFFAFVLDAYSRMVVGWQFAGNMRIDRAADGARNPRPQSPRNPGPPTSRGTVNGETERGPQVRVLSEGSTDRADALVRFSE